VVLDEMVAAMNALADAGSDASTKVAEQPNSTKTAERPKTASAPKRDAAA
jgi:hypothetical protein